MVPVCLSVSGSELHILVGKKYGTSKMVRYQNGTVLIPSGQDEHDSTAHDKSNADIESLIYNVQVEAENQQRLKKAIAAQPKMYNGHKLINDKFKVHLPDYEETLEDAKESRLKMKDKMIQLDYQKLNNLYDSFVPQTEISVEQTYLSNPSTSNVSSESSSMKSDLPPKKMPNESKLL
ncbi:hypothetical protein Tco_0717217 [Tanacetum coccineum]